MKLFIYGTIGKEVRSSDIVSQIGKNKDDVIDVHINSPGGSVYEGFAIYNALQRESLKRTVRTHIDGLAYSAASWISQAAKKGNRFMSKVSQFGIHQALNMGGGNKEDLENQIEQLAKIDEVQVYIYSQHTGLDDKDITAIMEAGKVLSYKEALSSGFIDGEAQTQKLAANFNLNTDMDFEKLSNLFKSAKGEAEVLDEVKEKTEAKLAEDLEKAETPAEVLTKDLVSASDFENYKGTVRPILEAIFEYISEQPKKEEIFAEIAKVSNKKMIELVSQIQSNKQVPTPEETAFNDKAEQVESYGPLNLGDTNVFELFKKEE